MKIFYTVLFIFVLISCSNSKEVISNNILLYDTSKPAEFYGMSNFIEEVDVHKLPLPDSVNVSIISKVVSIGSKLWVYDLPGKQLLAFDLECNSLLYRVYNEGEGPLEYTGIVDFDVDTEDNITVLDLRQRLIEFQKGTPIAEYRFSVETRGIANLNNGIVAVIPYEGPAKMNSLNVYDKNGNKTGEIGQFVNEVKGGIPPTYKQRLNDKELFLNDFTRNSIVHLENGKVVSEKKIEFDTSYREAFLLYFVHFNTQCIIISELRREEEEAIYSGIFKDGKHQTTISAIINDLDGLPMLGLFDAYNEVENALVKVNTSEYAKQIENYYSDENLNKYFIQEKGNYILTGDRSIKIPTNKFESMRTKITEMTSQDDNYLILQKFKVK